jgi:cold shock protein
MNKGSDYWTPRKRGFDDDGPMTYAPRQRTARPNGQPDGFGGEGPASDMTATVNQPTVDAVVKWYKDDKGFGFVELANGQGDAFLHATVLHASGHEAVSPGARMQVVVAMGAKGPQIARVVSVDSSTAIERPRRAFDAPRPARRQPPDLTEATPVEGRVKWFNESKGFGFVAVDDGGKDIFIHISALNAAGIAHLDEGQPVNMQVVETPRGREAVSIRV